VYRELLAVDPGNTESAYVLFDLESSKLVEFGKVPNAELRRICMRPRPPSRHFAIEMIASYGMAVGAEVFETCVWIGRLIEAWDGDHTKVYRKDVKLHLCGQSRAKDANIRQALLDQWGGKAVAMGTKRAPGPLYGVSADVWSALAVAVTWAGAERTNG
jgi:hypothetical protein